MQEFAKKNVHPQVLTVLMQEKKFAEAKNIIRAVIGSRSEGHVLSIAFASERK